MYSQEKNEVKVKIATRQQAVSNEVTLLSGLLLFVVLSVIVLIGRSMGGM